MTPPLQMLLVGLGLGLYLSSYAWLMLSFGRMAATAEEAAQMFHIFTSRKLPSRPLINLKHEQQHTRDRQPPVHITGTKICKCVTCPLSSSAPCVQLHVMCVYVLCQLSIVHMLRTGPINMLYLDILKTFLVFTTYLTFRNIIDIFFTIYNIFYAWLIQTQSNYNWQQEVGGQNEEMMIS